MISAQKAILKNNRRILTEWKSLMDRTGPDDEGDRGFSFKHRFLVYGIESAICAFLAPFSSSRGDESLLIPAEKAARILLNTLNEDGTCNCINLATPPDTGFAAERAGVILVLLRKEKNSATKKLTALLEDYLKKTCDALTTGGIHTPNHRWVVSSALAYGFHILEEESYRKRAEAWLGEGIDIDEEGQFSERSTSIYSPVTALCLINIAEYLGKPELFEPVRRHLDLTRWLFKPDGTTVTLASRRQDLFYPGNPDHYYLAYLIMAGKDQSGTYARMARFIEETGHLPPAGLTEMLSGRADNIPEPSGDPLPRGFRFLSGSGLYRSFEGNRFLTLFGGCDNEKMLKHASGLSGNPTFMSLQSGPCSLESVRIAPRFFGLGYFRADSLEIKGNRAVLEQTLSVPYFDRLSEEKIKADGDYGLTSAGRYWSKMDFPERDLVNVQELTIRVEAEINDNRIDMTVSCKATAPVPVALEFMFPEEGELKGTWLTDSDRPPLFEIFGAPRPDNMKILKEGKAIYSRSGRALTVSGGRAEHDWLPYLQKGDYMPLEIDGDVKQFVYMTLYAPFEIKVAIEG